MENPDAWVIVRFSSGYQTTYKLLMSWYGGYTGSNSWHLNSGIASFEEYGDSIIFKGLSGSSYTCYKHTERESGLISNLLCSWMTEPTLIKVEVVNYDELKLNKDLF